MSNEYNAKVHWGGANRNYDCYIDLYDTHIHIKHSMTLWEYTSSSSRLPMYIDIGDPFSPSTVADPIRVDASGSEVLHLSNHVANCDSCTVLLAYIGQVGLVI